jgi:hypothetical protein
MFLPKLPRTSRASRTSKISSLVMIFDFKCNPIDQFGVFLVQLEYFDKKGPNSPFMMLYNNNEQEEEIKSRWNIYY